MSPFRALVSAGALAAAVGACGDGEVSQPGAIGFSQVYSTIFSKRCLPCHATGIGVQLGLLDMSTEQAAYTNLLGVKASSAYCIKSGLTLVVPGSAQTSLLYIKVDSPLTMTPTPCGDTMPDDGTNLSQADVTLIQTWIDDGANR